MKRLIQFLVLFALLLSVPSHAAVQTVREDSESPFVSVSRSTFYGALAGSVVGIAIMLIANGNDDGDIFKVAFVGGTALGLGYGIYHVSTRPSDPSLSMIQFQNGKLAKLTMPSLSFRPVENSGWKVNASLLSVRF